MSPLVAKLMFDFVNVHKYETELHTGESNVNQTLKNLFYFCYIHVQLMVEKLQLCITSKQIKRLYVKKYTRTFLEFLEKITEFAHKFKISQNPELIN